MNSVAILKHVSIKNTDYGEGQRYLLFEHDPRTRKLLRDENGRMILRKGFIQSGFDCDPFTYNTECTELNWQFRKNLARNSMSRFTISEHICLQKILILSF